PTENAITTAAKVAWGMGPIAGARKRSVASVTAAVARAATCVRAPAFRLTAVCEVPPPPGIAPNRPPTTFAAPVATSSWFGPGRRGRRETPAGGDRLREAHERHGYGRGPERLEERRIRPHERREPARDVPDDGDARRLQVEEDRGHDAAGHREERRREARREV